MLPFGEALKKGIFGKCISMQIMGVEFYGIVRSKESVA